MRLRDNAPPRDALELLARYLAGERSFGGADLRGVNLPGARLSDADLTRAKLAGVSLRDATLVGVQFRDADLRNADLRNADLRNADLLRANLAGADLRGANLSGAELRAANLTDTNLIEAGFPDADLNYADLTGSNLTDAFLQHVSLRCARIISVIAIGADFTGADLVGANLTDADLSDAHLVKADMDGAFLICASVAGADMSEASLVGADLTGASCRGAVFVRADLNQACLDDSDFGSAVFSGTKLLQVNLHPLCEADPSVNHAGRSFVDEASIVKSLRAPNLKDFLLRAGMQETFAEYMIECAKSLGGSIMKRMLQSTFVSYGGPDEAFARRLYEGLHRSGVTTFFFPEHAIPGEKVHRAVRNGLSGHDRVVLICSRASLDRKGVLSEIEETLAREFRDGGDNYLIPIRLDDYVFTGWNPKDPDVARAVRDRVVADFRGADKDSDKFQAGLRKLIAALRK